MVTQENTQILQETTTWSTAAQQSKQFRWHNKPREIKYLSTLFSCVVFKNTAIEAETKRNRMANETSAIETPPAPKEAAGVPPYLPTNPNPTQSIE